MERLRDRVESGDEMGGVESGGVLMIVDSSSPAGCIFRLRICGGEAGAPRLQG